MERKVLVISVKPEYAYKILSGEKKIELRKNTPKVSKDDLVIIYATNPLKAIVGYCRVRGIIIDNPKNIWNSYKNEAGISKDGFSAYYRNSLYATGILFKDVNSLSNRFTLERVKSFLPNFKPPQSFSYISISDTLNTYKFISNT